MAEGARIYSVDAVRGFRAALIKYAEGGNVALTSADGDIDRALGWLERDQSAFWAGQVRKRHEAVVKCEDAVRQKRIFKSADGGTQSVVDEMKALSVAKRREDEAVQKVGAVKKAILVLRKESQLYKGRVQRLATIMSADIPQAVHRIDRMMDQVDAYLSVQTTGKGIDLAAAAESIAKAGAGLSSKTGPEKLRDRTPKPAQRQAAAFVTPGADHAVNQPWGAGVVQDWQLKALLGLAVAPQVPDPDHRIVAHPDVWRQGKIYLERLEPTAEDDSGWYVGPAADDFAPPAGGAEGTEVGYVAMRVGDVIAARPDLSDFLSLPTGTLAVLDAGGPSAVLDSLGLDIWSLALIKAAEPAADDTPAAADAAPATPTAVDPVAAATSA